MFNFYRNVKFILISIASKMKIIRYKYYLRIELFKSIKNNSELINSKKKTMIYAKL